MLIFLIASISSNTPEETELAWEQIEEASFI